MMFLFYRQDLHFRLNGSYLSITIANLACDLEIFLSIIHGLNEINVLFIDKFSSHLSCSGQFFVICVEELIEQNNSLKPHWLWKLSIHQTNFTKNQFFN